MSDSDRMSGIRVEKELGIDINPKLAIEYHSDIRLQKSIGCQNQE